MISFQDFFPPTGSYFMAPRPIRSEVDSDTVVSASEWIEQEKVAVINVETVTERAGTRFIRVWYHAEGRAPRTTLPKPAAGDALPAITAKPSGEPPPP